MRRRLLGRVAIGVGSNRRIRQIESRAGQRKTSTGNICGIGILVIRDATDNRAGRVTTGIRHCGCGLHTTKCATGSGQGIHSILSGKRTGIAVTSGVGDNLAIDSQFGNSVGFERIVRQVKLLRTDLLPGSVDKHILRINIAGLVTSPHKINNTHLTHSRQVRHNLQCSGLDSDQFVLRCISGGNHIAVSVTGGPVSTGDRLGRVSRIVNIAQANIRLGNIDSTLAVGTLGRTLHTSDERGQVNAVKFEPVIIGQYRRRRNQVNLGFVRSRQQTGSSRCCRLIRRVLCRKSERRVIALGKSDNLPRHSGIDQIGRLGSIQQSLNKLRIGNLCGRIARIGCRNQRRRSECLDTANILRTFTGNKPFGGRKDMPARRRTIMQTQLMF